MVSTTITFEKDAVQPPVFVAGGFTDWEPVEMRCETAESNGSTKNVFSHKIDLAPGEYQYKFRLGPGDWWVLDESTPTAPDENGNLNNLLSVKPNKSNATVEPSAGMVPTPTVRGPNTKETPIIGEALKLNGSTGDEEYARPDPPAGEILHDLDVSGASQASRTPREPPRAEHEKQVQFDEQTGTITAETIQPRKDSFPDIAPPPYSASVDATVDEPQDDAPVARVEEVLPQKNSARPAVVKAQAETRQPSVIGQICSGRGLVLILTMVGIPIAVSYYLRR